MICRVLLTHRVRRLSMVIVFSAPPFYRLPEVVFYGYGSLFSYRLFLFSPMRLRTHYHGMNTLFRCPSTLHALFFLYLLFAWMRIGTSLYSDEVPSTPISMIHQFFAVSFVAYARGFPRLRSVARSLDSHPHRNTGYVSSPFHFSIIAFQSRALYDPRTQLFGLLITSLLPPAL